MMVCTTSVSTIEELSRATFGGYWEISLPGSTSHNMSIGSGCECKRKRKLHGDQQDVNCLTEHEDKYAIDGDKTIFFFLLTHSVLSFVAFRLGECMLLRQRKLF